LFCAIAAGDATAARVRETARTVAFRDINPQAPSHVLVIPKAHHRDVAALAAVDGGLLAEVLAQAHEVALADGIAQTGYRVVFNTGNHAGQSVHHVHAHVLGGKRMGWPPWPLA
jgi:histidine triad (HIT) family protein